MDRRLLALILVSATMFGGCRFFPSSSWSYEETDVGYSDSSLVVENGWQEGQMGGVSDFASDTIVEQGYAYPDYAHIRLESVGGSWWVMSLVDIDGDIQSFEPGRIYNVTPTTGTLDGARTVDVTGCSGPEQGNWDYDRHAERVEVEVEELGEGLRRFHFRAYFDYDGREQLTTGAFDYRITG